MSTFHVLYDSSEMMIFIRKIRYLFTQWKGKLLYYLKIDSAWMTERIEMVQFEAMERKVMRVLEMWVWAGVKLWIFVGCCRLYVYILYCLSNKIF